DASAVTGSASLSTAVTTSSGVGSYPITVTAGTLSAANYDFTSVVNGTLTVAPAHLTVTAVSPSSPYASPIPNLGATISGFLPPEPAALVSGSAAASTTATATSRVGSYPIRVSVGSLSAANYDFTNLVGGSLRIDPVAVKLSLGGLAFL